MPGGPTCEFSGRTLECDENSYVKPIGEDELSEAKKLVSPKAILDVGCSCGASAIALSQAFPGADILGIDVLPEQVVFASRNVPEVRFEVRDVFTMDLSPYDLVVWNTPYRKAPSEGEPRDTVLGKNGWFPAHDLVRAAESQGYGGVLLVSDGATPLDDVGGRLLVGSGAWYIVDMRGRA